MCSTNKESYKNAKPYLLFLYFSLYMIGLLLAYWFGFGWFMLLHTVRVLLTSVTQLYILSIRILMSSEYANEMELKLKDNPLFVSPSSAMMLLINVILTLLAFWKFNPPLYRIFEMMN